LQDEKGCSDCAGRRGRDGQVEYAEDDDAGGHGERPAAVRRDPEEERERGIREEVPQRREGFGERVRRQLEKEDLSYQCQSGNQRNSGTEP
jgi:ribosome-binding protein aMBF1 (putative translation factor)